MIISAHQSQYLPWLPYFKKIALSDKFVFIDNVQFHRGGFQNRTLICSHEKEKWLSLTINKGKLQDLICEKHVVIESWVSKHIDFIKQSYNKAPYFEKTMAILLPIFEQLEQSEETNLNEINKAFLIPLLTLFKINTPIITLSSLAIKSAKSELILDTCLALNAKTYLTGTGAKNYLKVDDFDKHNITIVYMSSKPPEYQVKDSTFISGLSILDILMHQPIDYIINEIHHA